jgi:hypothetical protein
MAVSRDPRACLSLQAKTKLAAAEMDPSQMNAVQVPYVHVPRFRETEPPFGSSCYLPEVRLGFGLRV